MNTFRLFAEFIVKCFQLCVRNFRTSAFHGNGCCRTQLLILFHKALNPLLRDS